MGSKPGVDLALVLLTRRDATRVLRADDEVTVRDLDRETDVSRTTAHRVLTELRELSIVEPTDGGYRMSAFGHAVASELEEFTGKVRAASRLGPVFDSLVETPIEFDLAWFDGVTVTEATKENPYAPIERVESLVAKTSNELVLNNGLVAPQRVLERADEQAPGDALSHTMILDQRTLDHYREHYPAIVEKSFECDHANTLVAEEVPLDLSIFDDRLVIPWFEPNTGTVSVLFDSDDPDAMAWGEAVFEACRKDAMAVEKDSI